jgi:hypothetical protein
LLESIQEESNSFDSIISPSLFFSLLIFGFKRAHPVCISWAINRIGIFNWANNEKVWIVYVKFVAIYPEEQKLLIFVMSKIKEIENKSIYSKHILIEIYSILGRRESNLNYSIKARFTHVQKLIDRNKRRLKSIWDCVLQENNINFETILAESMESFEVTHKAFRQLLHQYPNNQYVYRLYSGFLKIIANHSKHQKVNNKIQKMQSKEFILKDDAHSFGMSVFSFLSFHFKEGLMSTENSSFQLESLDGSKWNPDASNDEKEVSSNILENLKTRIEQLKFPAIRFHQISGVLVFIIWFFLPFLILQIIFPTILSQWEKPLEHIHSLSFLQFLIYMITVLNDKYSLDEFQYTNRLIDLEYASEIPLPAFSKSHELKIQASFYIEMAYQYFQTISAFRQYKVNDKKYDLLRDILFIQVRGYTQFENSNMVKKFYAFPEAFLNFLLLSHRLYDLYISKQSNDFIQYAPEVWNSGMSAEPLSLHLFNARDVFLSFLDDDYKLFHKIIIIVMIIFFILYPIVNSTISYFIIKKENNDQELIFKALTSIPKSQVSKVSDSFNIVQATNGTVTDISDISSLNKQQERIINILNNVNEESNISLNLSSEDIILTICIIASQLIATYLLIDLYDSSFKQISTEVRHLTSFISACSYQFASSVGFYSWMGTIAGAGPPQLISEVEDNNKYSRLIMRGKPSAQFYNQARNGFENVSIGPFLSFAQIVTELNQNTPCIQNQSIPNSYHDAYQCLTTDMKFTLVFHFIQRIASDYMDTSINEIDLKAEEYDSIWDIQIKFLLEKLFIPKFF